jgi:hypothetical protein
MSANLVVISELFLGTVTPFLRHVSLFSFILQQSKYRRRGVYELSPSFGGVWSESVFYRFNDGPDGANPVGSVVLDPRAICMGLLISVEFTAAGAAASSRSFGSRPL